MARILYVTQGYCTHDRRFLEQIAKTGHEIWHVPCEAASLRSDLPRAGGTIHWCAPLSDGKVAPGSASWLPAAKSFRRSVREISPDLIHAGPIQTGGFFAALERFRPLLMMSWGSDVLIEPEKSASLKKVTQFALRRADMAIADCEAVRDRISELGGPQADRVVTLPWGIDLEQFRPRQSQLGLRERLGWQGCKVIVSTRAFEPIHGTMILLEAVKHVMEQADAVRLLMLGDGSLRMEVRSFLESNQLVEKVHLTGQVAEEMLPAYFAEADLYVSATLCDGSSISLLQAMGCRLPVIVTEGYGNNEWVTDGENGWLCPAGSTHILADKILRALRDETACAVASRANIRIVRERADWRRNFVNVLNAYDELLACKSFRSTHHAQLQNR